MRLHSIVLGAMLLVSIAFGAATSYYTISESEPRLPSELKNELKQAFLEEAKSSANVLSQSLKFEEGILQSLSRFTKQIYLNDTFIPSVPSYYHNSDIEQPPGTFYDEELEKRISYEASAYMISPRAFSEEYQEEYLSAEKEQVHPLTKVSPELKAEILRTAKQDHLLKTFYDNDVEFVRFITGFSSGFTRIYPWQSLEKEFDPALESWYSLGATGAKDVVFLLDASGSMKGEKFEKAKNMTLQLISSLGPKDRFNILRFNFDTKSVFDSLEVLTDSSYNASLEFLEKIRPDLSSNLNKGLLQSLEILNQYSSKTRNSLIISLTDGQPTAGITDVDEILENLEQNNGFVNAQFLFVSIHSTNETKIMQPIADETGGIVVTLNETILVSEATTRILTFFSQNILETVNWGFPEISKEGHGLILPAAIPVIVRNEVKGVVSSDIQINRIIELIKSSLTSGNTSYFLIDSGGITLFHSKFEGLSLEGLNPEDIQQPIEKFETDSREFVKMKDNAKQGIFSVGIISYNGKEKLVTLVPVGNTSMILGLTTQLDQILDSSIKSKMSELNIDPFVVFPSGLLGLGSAIIVYVVRIRVVADKEEVQ